MRREKFINGQCYHVFNRGTEKRNIFGDEKDYQRFLKSMREFNNKKPIGSLYLIDREKVFSGSTAKKAVEPLVNIDCYCLNDNHYHFILRQLVEGGISEFMKRLSGGYTWYFNKKYNRSGSLFQGRFKSVYIDSNEYLLYLSAYVNCNNFIHKYSEKVENWPYSSYLDYVGKREGKLCNKESILAQFNNNFKDYEKFCNMNAEYLRDKKEFSKYLLE